MNRRKLQKLFVMLGTAFSIGYAQNTDAKAVDSIKPEDYVTAAAESATLTDEEIAINAINAGESDTLKDYRTLGLSNVKKTNLDIVKSAIKSAKETKGGNLSKEEIITTVNTIINNYVTVQSNINSGKATVKDYSIFGVTKVNEDNITFINNLVKGKNYSQNVIQGLVDEIVKSLGRVNSASESESDYTTLEISNVKSEYIPIIRKDIAKAKEAKGASLSQEEISTVVKKVQANITSTLNTIIAGKATISDYEFIGITGVNSFNLGDVNEWLKGTSWTELANIQKAINTMVDTLFRINNGSSEIEDFQTLGLYDVDINNIEYVKEIIVEKKEDKGGDLNKLEVSNCIQEASLVIDFFSYIESDCATLDDYNDVGIVGVNEDNVGDFNIFLKGKSFKTVKKTQAYKDGILLSVKNINTNKAEVKDYLDIGITSVTSENRSQVSEDIKIAREEKGSDLTVTEIKASVEGTLKKIKVLEVINEGEATVDDYKAVGVVNVTVDNIVYVNGAVKGKGYKTVGEIQTSVDVSVKTYGAIKTICDGEGTVADYELVSIVGVTADNIVFVNADIKGKGYTTAAEVQASVDVSVKAYASILRIKGGDATLDDYKIIGVTGVNVKCLAFVNAQLKGKDYPSIPKIQAAVDVSVNVFAAIDRITDGEGTPEDYDIIAAVGVNADNIAFVNASVKGKDDLTLPAVKVKVDVAVAIYAAMGRVNDGNATLDDYNIIGIVGVDVDNIAAVNADLKGKNYWSVPEIQAAVDVTVNVYAAIGRINDGTATLDDYNLIAVVGVNVDNLVFVNTGIKGNDYKTSAEIQTAVDVSVKIYAAIGRISDGTAVLDDYNLIEAVGVNVDNLVFVNGRLKGNDDYTLIGIKNKVDIAVKAYVAIGKINDGIATLEDYDILGVVGVNSDNLVKVNVDIKGKNYSTVPEIQASVDVSVKVYAAIERINGGTAVLDDYNLIAVVGIDVDNLVFVNTDLKGKGYKTPEEIQVAVNVSLKIYASIGNINKGIGTIDDYVLIGNSLVTADNLVYVNAYLKNHNDFTVAGVNKKVGNAIAEYEIILKINAGDAVLDDYKLLNITGVTAASLSYINEDLKGKNYDNIPDIQARVDVTSKVFAAISRINSGKATLDDYTLLEIENVVDVNLLYVNSMLKGQKLETKSEIQIAVNTALSGFSAIEKINKGIAELYDYEIVGVVGITADNIVYINKSITGKNYSTVSAIQRFVDASIKEYEAIGRMNEGIATIDDFILVGVVGVTNANLVYVNADLKDRNYKTVPEIQASVDISVKVYTAIARINEGNGSLSDYSLLKVTGVTSDNIGYVNIDIKGKNLKTIPEIQASVNAAIQVYNILLRINAGTAIIDDYSLIEVYGITGDNIAYINSYLKGKNLNTVALIKENVEIAIKDYEAILRINAGKGTVEDYKNLGAIGVVDINLEYVNNDLNGKGYSTIAEICNAANKSVKTFDIFNRINAGTASLSDYSYIGIAGVIADNLAYINANLKDGDYATTVQVQAKVDVLADLYESIAKINNGIATLDDYKLLEIIGVDSENLVYVNADLQNRNLLLTLKIQDVINSNKDIYLALKNINLGVAELKDYTLIGAISVVEKNVAFLNVNLKGKNYLTATTAKRAVEKLLVENGTFGRINSGKGTLDDYKLVGATDVTADNISYINGEIKGNVDEYGTNIQSLINSALALYNEIQLINENKENKTQSGEVKEYLAVSGLKIAFDTKSGSILKNVQESVRIKRKLVGDRYLTREEIVSIINSVWSYNDDAVVVLGRIDEEIEKAKKFLGRELTSEEEEKLINDLTATMKKACRRIVVGEGTIEDFNFLGEKRVTSDNINIINKDIKDYKTVTKLSDFRLNGLSNAVLTGISIQSINNGTETAANKEYSYIGRNMSYDTSESSLFRLTQYSVSIKKDLLGRNLSRDEILNIIDSLSKSTADAAVMMPKINEAINKAKLESDAELKPEDEQKIIDSVIKKMKDAVSRVYVGKGTVEDFYYIGETRVTEENIDVINKDIDQYDTITKITDFRLNGLNSAVTSGIAVYAINRSSEETAVSDFKSINLSIAYETPETSKLKLIQSAIKIKRILVGGRYLTREEITEIYNDISKNLLDAGEVLPRVNDEINRQTKDKGEALTAEEITKIIEDVKVKVKEVTDRISVGKGTVEDFYYLGDTRVNSSNINIVNKDIADNETIKVLSGFRISGLNNAVTQGLAVFAINNGSEETAVNDYKALNMAIVYETPETSKLKLMQSAVKLKRILVGGRYLAREEIVDIYNNISKNLLDAGEILPRVNDEINRQTKDKGEALTAEEITKIIEDVKVKVKEVTDRVCVGKGSVEDFKYLGETRVNESNIDIVNLDIDSYGTVKILSDYRLSGLTDSVTRGIAVYSINKGTEDTAVADFASIGTSLSYETAETSRLKLIQSAIKIQRMISGNKFLTRAEILDIVSRITQKQEDAAVVIPELNDNINKAQKESEKALTADELKDIVNKTILNIKLRITRICAGEATVEDYRAIGELRITSENIDIANTDVKTFRTITKISDYRVQNVNQAVNYILNLLEVNLGFEREIHDGPSWNTYNWRVYQYEQLGKWLAWDTTEGSVLNLTKSAVKIMRILKEGGYVSREELINLLIDRITENQGDAAVMIPRLLDVLNDAKTAKGAELTGDEAKKLIDDELAKMKAVITRIAIGEASIDDYKYYGEVTMTEDILKIVNSDIKKYGGPRIVSNYRLDGVFDEVKIARAIYAINNATETAAANEYGVLGRTIAYEDSETGIFKLIQASVNIKRQLLENRYLTRDEILNIVDEVIASKEDAAVVLPRLKDAISIAIKESEEGKITAEDESKIIESLKTKIKDIVDRVSIGEGTVEDYAFLGETRVTKDNISTVNADIKAFRSITKISNYRLVGVTEAINKGMAVYSINKGTETKEVNEYGVLGRTITYDESETGLFEMIQSAISIKKELLGGRSLNRTEILETVDAIIASKDDAAVALLKIKDALSAARLSKGKDLTAEEEQKIIDETKNKIKSSVTRISLGKGTVDDYVSLGEKNVNKDNLEAINADIAENRTITKISDYRLSGLSEAVKMGLAIYDINNGSESINDNNVSEYGVIGRTVAYEYEEDSTFRMIQDSIEIKRKLVDNKLLTRTEILQIIDDIIKYNTESKVIIPKIKEDIFNKEDSGEKMTSEELQTLINTTKNNVRKAALRITLGKGTAEDYKMFGEKRVNSANLSVVNSEIKANKTVKRSTNYSLVGLTESVDYGIAVYKLNIGDESKDSSSNITELNTLGVTVKYEDSDTSVYKIVKTYIQIKRRLAGGACISGEEIVNLVKEVQDNLKDYVVKVPNAMNAIEEAELDSDTELTTEEVKALVDKAFK